MAYLVKKCNDFAIDGTISAKEWEQAEEWAFSRLGQRDSKLGATLNEVGTVKMLHSDKYWYIAVDMEDSDVVGQGTGDQQHHYTMGDTIEVFLKPPVWAENILVRAVLGYHKPYVFFVNPLHILVKLFTDHGLLHALHFAQGLKIIVLFLCSRLQDDHLNSRNTLINPPDTVRP